MNRERLLKLADYLETEVAKNPQLFDMSHWGKVTGCGTVCCAFGHAASIPEFRDAGLRLCRDERHILDPAMRVVFEDLDGYEAAEAFFDLDEADANSLFSPYAYDHPHDNPALVDVVARIREFAGQPA